MEFFLIIAGICLLIWIVRRAYRKGVPATRYTPPSPQPRAGPYRPPLKEGVYRPDPRRQNRIIFINQGKGGGRGGAPTSEALEGLHDAFTGAVLDPARGLHQCSNCKVYYHAESVAVLTEANAGRCVACGISSVVALTEAQAATSKGRDYSPDVVTLANYHHHFDRVVTFDGLVRSVRSSRRGGDYAVMFEDKSWAQGLKLVFFRGAVRKVGGPRFVEGLQGHHVRVRGLLIRHDRFGPEIVISEAGMILEVR